MRRTPRTSLLALGPGKVLRAEMGAQWIQSATGNPITALAKKMGLPIGSMNSDDQHYTATGKAYTDSEAGDAEDAYSALEDARKEYTDALKSDMSLDAAYRKVDKKTYLTPYVQVWLSDKLPVWLRDSPKFAALQVVLMSGLSGGNGDVHFGDAKCGVPEGGQEDVLNALPACVIQR